MMNNENIFDMVKEYKDYIELKLMNNSFDFTTWCEHQYGKSPDDLIVVPVLSFDVAAGKKDHK